MSYKVNAITPPSLKEKRALRLMIFIGIVAIAFFLYSVFKRSNISYLPLYILLMITLIFYCFKYLHEWYHYFSIAAPADIVSKKVYTVDIFTTFCAGEPLDMLEETLTAIQNITYPHNTWCCDEANDETVKAMCTRLGVQHVTRVIKKDAKAGNINNALQYATGELCVILDPDHIPAPAFLDQLVGHFDNPEIGFVQVVQAYYNQKISLVAKGAAQQTYQFYGPMMMAMHSYGTVQAIGANCTFRRAALDSIGGHASGLSEDMHTAMQLHARGWRSMYVPAILTRGLVPSTMSAYYKQQLKWSRGTWELLLAVYPHLFKNFTWRQKVHYLTLPFHYFCGFIFLINFLIPVISLFSGYVPLKMDLLSFLLATMPVFTMSILIRYYVQKWVAEDTERGFHVVGGILQIGTWWIYCTGFIYTLLRKKVPYIPTPKTDDDPLPFALNLPNIMVAVISLTAVVYGVAKDYNPYTIFMVVLAMMQVFFMIFILSISGYTSNTSKANSFAMKLRQHTWLIKKSHAFLRKYSLILSFILIVCFFYGYRQHQQLPTFLPKPLQALQIFYRGISGNKSLLQNDSSGILSIAAKDKNIAIISMEILSTPDNKTMLDTGAINKVYSLKAIPFLNWTILHQQRANENTSKADTIQQASKDDDAVIMDMANQLGKLNKPVFLNCNANPDDKNNLFYIDSLQNPQAYIRRWQHLHDLFGQAACDKVIWVWTTADAKTADNYFPGKAYADWICVDMEAASSVSLPEKIQSFDSLYRPFHQLKLFKKDMPVLVAQTLFKAGKNKLWWADTWKNIDTAFKEIKAVLLSVSNAGSNDKNDIGAAGAAVKSAFASSPVPNVPLWPGSINNESAPKNVVHSLPANIKSVVYNKGYKWFRNKHTLNVRIMEQDIAAMKSAGINTVERTMPGFYDNNLGRVLASSQMNLIPSFSYNIETSFLSDAVQMKAREEEILKVVRDNKDKKYIIAWGLGNDVLYNLYNQSYLPDYLYYQQKYVQWLYGLCGKIKQIDPERPVIADIQWDEHTMARLKYYKNAVPFIDEYRVAADARYTTGLGTFTQGLLPGKIAVELWPMVPSVKQSAIIPEWQDIQNTNFVSLTGLFDLEGRKKELYLQVQNYWAGMPVTHFAIPEIKILKPAQIVRGNTVMTYQALTTDNFLNWHVFPGNTNVQLEWYLVRADQYGNTMFIKKVGDGNSIDLKIPEDPQYYQIMAEAVLGDEVKVVRTTLNIPLE